MFHNRTHINRLMHSYSLLSFVEHLLSQLQAMALIFPIFVLALGLVAASGQSILTQMLISGHRPIYESAANTTQDADSDYENYVNTTIDQFSKKSNPSNFSQRYFVNSAYSTKSGIHFLVVEGDHVATSDKIVNETFPVVAQAKDLGATLWLLEHRYYGQSRPYKQTSVKVIR
jgi:hypothetical protein